MSAALDHKLAGVNARRAFRFSVGLPAGYLIYNQWCDCEILNVSNRGAAVQARQVFLQGDALRLRIAFEGREAEIDARVAHSSGVKTGIVFSQRDRGRIEAFLSLVDDFLVHKARAEVRDYFKNQGEMTLPARYPFGRRQTVPIASFP